MASVTFPVGLGGNGSTYTDDSNPSTGMASGGHRTRFVPCLSQTVIMGNSAASSATAANISKGDALTYSNNASASATLAANWASYTGGFVPTTSEYSAKYHAQAAAASAAAAAGTAAFVDTSPVVKGSADATKFLRFEVDGFTTATTRTVTVPNKSGTMAMLDDLAGLNGGALITSTGTNLVLTSASERVQIVTATADNLTVKFPAATTLNKGGPQYVVRNDGAKAFSVIDGNNGFLDILAPGRMATYYLTSNATTAGTWAISSSSLEEVVYNSVPTTVVSSSTNIRRLVPLTSVQTMVLYGNGSGFVCARTLNNSGTVITTGAELVVNGVNTAYMGLAQLSSTTALAVWSTGVASLNACVLTVSGTTITAGTTYNIATTAVATNLNVVSLTATQSVVQFLMSSNNYARTIDISGGVITMGTEFSLGGGNSLGHLTPINTTQAVTSVSTSLRVLTATGTTLSVGTNQVVTGTPTLATVSSTKVLVIGNSGSSAGHAAYMANISGTNITLAQESYFGEGTLQIASVAKLSTTQAIVTYPTSGLTNSVVINYPSDEISVGPVKSIGASSSSLQGVAAIGTNQAVALVSNNSNFLQATTLTVTA